MSSNHIDPSINTTDNNETQHPSEADKLAESSTGAQIRREEALAYHAEGRPGKITVVPTKPTLTQRDLSMAYSPGVAEPCLEIARDPSLVNKYTAKGNLVGVVSNGTAVLGLGNIGPEASKPVMEGKGVLFKVFADIDVFDIEVNEEDVDAFVAVVKAIAPTFGGINLEDIKAPECFAIEERLKAELNIPVMHDDQHGTAIIVGAAMLNALEIVGKQLDAVRIIVNGAGASALSCIRILVSLGCKQENFLVFDSKGLVHTDRTDLDAYKRKIASNHPDQTLEEALKGADVFIGLSKGNVLNTQMVQSMGSDPILLALANPTPEISYELALEARPEIIMGTGRSDYPNQVNNVLGFPYLFRGALDVEATCINEEMKLAAVKALAQLAKQPVPESVANAYHAPEMKFGKDYIIPKPIDPRLLVTVAPAVALAAMESGVARKSITDWEAYKWQLKRRLGMDQQFTQTIMDRAMRDPKRVAFADGDHEKVIKAVRIALDEGIVVRPFLLGPEEKILSLLEEHHVDPSKVEIVDPLKREDLLEEYGQLLWMKRQRKGVTLSEAVQNMKKRNYMGAMMVEQGWADALITGVNRKYPTTIRPLLEVIGAKNEYSRHLAGLYVLITPQGPLFLSDTTINIDPSAEELVNIAQLTASAVRIFDHEPRIAMLSYNNFGSAQSTVPDKVRKATKTLKEMHPDWIIEGEMQANFALNEELTKEYFPFSALADGRANTLIFPDLSSANIAYKLLQQVADTEAFGPIILGMRKPAHVLQLGASVREIVNLTAIAVMDAQLYQRSLSV